MIRQRQVKCLGISINYIDEGHGENLLFIHNGGGFWQIWTEQLEYFRNTHRVLAIDLPGFGDSDESEIEYSLDYFTSVVREFLLQLHIDKVSLIGNCIGASISIHLQNQSPALIDKMILMNICPGERLIRSRLFRFLLFKFKSKRFQKPFKRFIIFVIRRANFLSIIPSILFKDHPDKKSMLFIRYREKMRESKQTRSRIKLLFVSNTYTLKSFVQDSPGLRKACLLWGAENSVASVRREGIHHRNLCGIETMTIVKDAGHMLMYEQADLTNQLIESHLKS